MKEHSPYHLGLLPNHLLDFLILHQLHNHKHPHTIFLPLLYTLLQFTTLLLSLLQVTTLLSLLLLPYLQLYSNLHLMDAVHLSLQGQT